MIWTSGEFTPIYFETHIVLSISNRSLFLEPQIRHWCRQVRIEVNR